MTAAAAFAVLCGAPMAAAAHDGWYVGAEGGVSFVDAQDYKVDGTALNPGPFDAEVEFDDGWLGGLVFGYSFSNGLRTELAANRRSNDLSQIHLGSFGPLQPARDADNVGGEFIADTALLNFWYDFNKPGRWHPYIGAGLGVAEIQLEDMSFDNVSEAGDDDAVFAWQGGAGIGFDLSRHWTLSLDYRYIETDDAKLHIYDNDPDTGVEMEYSAHAAMLTLRYFFSAPEPEAPPPPEPPVQVVPPVEPPPPPPPPPCEAPRADESFSLEGCKTGDTLVLHGVTFEFDKATLTPDARTLLNLVSDALLARPDIQVEVAGHTDSKGSEAYNQELSERRAQSVRQYLMGRGIEASRMTAVGYGETTPVADNETDAGRELNRRVELKVTGSSAAQ